MTGNAANESGALAELGLNNTNKSKNMGVPQNLNLKRVVIGLWAEMQYDIDFHAVMYIISNRKDGSTDNMQRGEPV